MDFALTENHRMLRDSAASFVNKETSLDALLVPGATVQQAPLVENWRKMCALGWSGLAVPEELGGVGLDCVDLTMIVTELGRALIPNTLAGQTFGIWALLAAADKGQQERLLPELAEGSARIALVPPIDSNAVSAANDRLDGSHPFVIDAADVDWLVITALNDKREWVMYLVDAHAEGVSLSLQPWRDITRQVCRVELRDVCGEPLQADVRAVWPVLHAHISLWLAAENVGGMKQVLDSTVEYAKERRAFGRPIGAYQAIKHPLAEMFGHVESAATANLYAAWALSEGDERALLAASMAKAYSSDWYTDATHRSIQIFGAIGFTWEMKNHLYYKRARGNAGMFGDVQHHRDNVINLATGRSWSTPFELDPRNVA